MEICTGPVYPTLRDNNYMLVVKKLVQCQSGNAVVKASAGFGFKGTKMMSAILGRS